jgi:hypothetical protein
MHWAAPWSTVDRAGLGTSPNITRVASVSLAEQSVVELPHRENRVRGELVPIRVRMVRNHLLYEGTGLVPVGVQRTSGLAFEDVGEYELKGLSDHWRLLRVVPEPG